ncbi:NAD(P)-binding protein [Ganoderma leucocontextum]|nr:NAD(P)-binding protein [Ganoderma leucocontextum]
MSSRVSPGASSGFGLAMARLALAKGERVVATLRRPEVLQDLASQHPPEQLLVPRLDVSQPAEIKDAFSKAKATFDRVDIVFNNAGVVPTEPARAMFDEAVQFYRDENVPQGGRLIQNSAGMGLVTMPAFAFYASSKHGEHSETSISSVLCGGFASEFQGLIQVFPQHPAYADCGNAAAAMRDRLSKHVAAGSVEDQKKLGFSDSAKGVQKIYELSELPNPPFRVLLGKDINKRVRQYIVQLTQEVDEYAAWSDDLGCDS